MRSSSRRSLRRSNRTPREQFIALAGVAAGGPFLLLGFLPLDFLCWSSFRWASLSGRDLPRCWGVAFSDRFSAECRLKVVGICQAATAWHFATKTIQMGLPERSQNATLRQPGILRPKQSGWTSQDGRDLPLCYSLAFRDRFSAEGRPKMVGICRAVTARQIPTIPFAGLPPPACPPRPALAPVGPSHLAAGPTPAPPPPPPAARRAPASRRTLPIGGSVQTETFVATQDARLFR